MALRVRHLMLIAAHVLSCWLAVGCYRPDRRDCQLRCGEVAACPADMTCSAGFCTRGQACAAGDAGSAGDLDAPAPGGADSGAPADGPSPLACQSPPDPDQCPGGLAACGTPCEVKLATDPNHCGRCGRSCHGGTCVKGQCEPVALATGQSFRPSSRLVAANARGVYWADGRGAVMALPFVDGTIPLDAQPRVVAKDQGMIGGLVVDGRFAYLMTTTGDCDPGTCLRRISLDPEHDPVVALKLAEMGDTSAGLVIDDKAIYWGDSRTWKIVRHVPGELREPQPIVPDSVSPPLLAIDREYAYWGTQVQQKGVIQRARLDATSPRPEDIVTGIMGPTGVVVDGDNVYWADGSTGRIQMTAKAGNGPVFTLATNQNHARELAIDGANLYWGFIPSVPGMGLVSRCGLDQPVRRLDIEENVPGIVTGNGHAFFHDDKGSLYRLPW